MNNQVNEILVKTVVLFGLISALLYYFILRPSLPANNNNNTQGNNNGQGGDQGGGGAATQGRQGTASSSADNNAALCTRVPPHIAPSSAKIAVSGGSNLLTDGLLAFRHGNASSHEQSLEPEVLSSNRKERARLLANLLETTSGKTAAVVSAPPAKGTNLVLSIPVADVGCSKLRRAVYLLATYYNLLVILAVDSNFENKAKADVVAKLRGAGEENAEPDQQQQQQVAAVLAKEVLPDHRIVAASTVAGRVAFVRQLQRIELVLDFDPEVDKLLTRFGHRVIVYGQKEPDNAAETGTSKLGRALLSN